MEQSEVYTQAVKKWKKMLSNEIKSSHNIDEYYNDWFKQLQLSILTSTNIDWHILGELEDPEAFMDKLRNKKFWKVLYNEAESIVLMDIM